jgi:hypothetical protein
MSPRKADGRPPTKISARQPATAESRIRDLERQVEVLTADLDECRARFTYSYADGYDEGYRSACRDYGIQR